MIGLFILWYSKVEFLSFCTILKMLQRRLKNVTCPLRFRNLNSPCTRISTHIDVYEPWEDDYSLFMANSMTYVFVSYRQPCLCPSKGRKHGVSLHSLINLSKTLFHLNISCTKHCTDLNLCKTVWIILFIFFYLFDRWLFLMMVWQWKPAIMISWLIFSSNCTWLSQRSACQYTRNYPLPVVAWSRGTTVVLVNNLPPPQIRKRKHCLIEMLETELGCQIPYPDKKGLA